jgi:3-dehydroquinate dehydratase/shikimate dehydrogenase
MDFAKQLNIKGFSVTIPHKETVIPLLREIDSEAEEIGACNTVINFNGTWKGYNTDCIGFEKALLEFSKLKNLKHKKVAIIGAGGASRAICYEIKKLGGKACVFNRTLAKARLVASSAAATVTVAIAPGIAIPLFCKTTTTSPGAVVAAPSALKVT